MGGLRFYLFGSLTILRGDQNVEVQITRKQREVLGFLLLNRDKRHAREQLAGIFWGDIAEDRARSCLNTALWRLRRVLEDDGVPRGTYIRTHATGEVSFGRPEAYWLDVAEFENVIERFLSTPVDQTSPTLLEGARAALELYRGDLMEGFFEEWTAADRERLQSLRVKALAHLTSHHRAGGDLEAGLHYGHQVLEIDPFREEVHRELMSLYLMNGQRARAALQYEHCRRILETQLGVPPTMETRELYAQIVPHAEEPKPSPRLLGPEPARASSVLEEARRIECEVQDVRSSFERVEARLRHLTALLAAQDGQVDHSRS